MTRTKSMTYNSTTESRELFVYVTNNSELHRQYIIPALNNLRKKAQKGSYDGNKAIDLWYSIATAGSTKYGKDFGYTFSVQDRYTVAVDLEEYYREDVEADN